MLESTPFARLLVIRALEAGREAQVTLLLDASPALPVAGPSLAGIAGGWQGVHWSWDAPLDQDVAYSSVPAAIDGVRRAMRTVAPTGPSFVQREAARARLTIAAGLLALALVILFSATQPVPRAAALLLPLWAVTRSGVATSTLGDALLPALLMAMALVLAAIVLWRRATRRTVVGLIVAVVLLALATPLGFYAARLILPASELESPAVWFGWEAVLALLLTGYLAVAAAPLLASDDEHASPQWGALAALAALVVGAIAVEAWGPGGWPTWYQPLLILPLVLFLPVTSRRSRFLALATAAAAIAALGTWSTSLEARMASARTDLARLGAPVDPAANADLDDFARAARDAHATRLDRLYAAWRVSALWRDSVPTYLSLWDSTGRQLDEVPLDSLSIRWDDLDSLVRDNGDAPHRIPLARGAGHHEVLILPLTPDTIATVTIGPRSRLLVPTAFGLLTGWRSPAEPSYRVVVIPDPLAAPDTLFHRDHRYVRTDRIVTAGEVPRAVRAEIAIPKPQQFAVRAALVVVLDLIVAYVMWLALQRLFGSSQPLVSLVFRRSYRRTIATALTAFFIVPAMVFALWSVFRLKRSAADQRSAEVAETLRDVAVTGGFAIAESASPNHDSLAITADAVNAELGVYRRGRLIASSTPMLEELGFLPSIITVPARTPPGTVPAGPSNGLPDAHVRLGGEPTAQPGTVVVAALPGGETDFELDQIDLAMLLLLVSLTGAAAAVGVAGLVARALGQPIDTLRRTALAIGKHEVPPLARDVPAEFVPVFGAINQMERDLRASGAELRAGRARTAAILATVATGVIGVDADGRVIHANPRAAELLGTLIAVGEPIAGQLPASWQPIAASIAHLLQHVARNAESHELEIGEQRFGVTLAPLAVGGLVCAITDITEASRAARILAWGEMARQVAHEIKNPLTPMRLGLQHLKRVDPRTHPDYPRLVGETAERLLIEIERLDRIARSFARYGAPPDRERAPLEPIALATAVEEMAALFALTSEQPRLEVAGVAAGRVLARKEELAQVLLNLLDNARQAEATRVRLVLGGAELRVEDDGRGIPAGQLARIFEPAFSTTTSGTGLGLAIVRRLVEGWGGTIAVESEPGRGTTFTLRFEPAAGAEHI
jgi:signal transduction histidine kinase